MTLGMFWAFLAQYGGGGSDTGTGGGSGYSAGYWWVVGIVAVAALGLLAWFILRVRTRRQQREESTWHRAA